MIGHQPIVAMRMRGVKPVHVWLDMEREGAFTRSWHRFIPDCAQVFVEPKDRVPQLDLRFLVGLSVTLWAGEWSERYGELIDAVKAQNPLNFSAHAKDMEAIVWQR